MRSSEAINAIGSVAKDVFNWDGIKAGYGYMQGKGTKRFFGEEGKQNGLAEAMFGGHEKDLTHFSVNGNHYNGAKIAGSLGGLALGYRFASGGGLYRDKDGNTDIAGIPFI